MQSEKRNVSPIKQRILQFIDFLHISKREFYMRTSISRGTLDNSTGITEDTLAKLFTTYKNINPSWLITGEGLMIIDIVKEFVNLNDQHEPEVDHKKCQVCNEKDRIIDSLKEQIAHYQKEIEWLRHQIECRDKTKNK